MATQSSEDSLEQIAFTLGKIANTLDCIKAKLKQWLVLNNRQYGLWLCFTNQELKYLSYFENCPLLLFLKYNENQRKRKRCEKQNEGEWHKNSMVNQICIYALFIIWVNGFDFCSLSTTRDGWIYGPMICYSEMVIEIMSRHKQASLNGAENNK